MMRYRSHGLALLAMVGVLVTVNAEAKEPSAKAAAPSMPPAHNVLEPKALDLLKAMSSRLAAAKTLSFQSVSTEESPSLLGPALAYTTVSEVTMQRPDKLRVLTPGDGPASEFYYDGKTMMAYEPESNLVATAAAASTVDATLATAYDMAAIYFPFTDVLLADPYKNIAEGMRVAFVVGQSKVVGGVTTDIVAMTDDKVFAQIWIGADDKLPRQLRAVYLDDPSKLRHQVEFSNWKLDGAVSPDTFTSSRAAAANHIQFARPDLKLPEEAPPKKLEPSEEQK
jgi:hypothetical protein